MDLELEQNSNGVIIPLKVIPKAKRNSIIGIHQGRLKVSVTQAPEKGKANQAVIQFLAKELGIKKSQLALVSGETSQTKQILVSGITLQEVQEIIVKVLNSE